jgi:hypothetical protein
MSMGMLGEQNQNDRISQRPEPPPQRAFKIEVESKKNMRLSSYR